MIPSKFIAVDKFPLTPNDKIDRKALLQMASQLQQEQSAPVSPDKLSKHEQIILRICYSYIVLLLFLDDQRNMARSTGAKHITNPRQLL